MKDVKTSTALLAMTNYFKEDPLIKDFCQTKDQKLKLAEKLKLARESKGESIEEIAKHLGTDPSVITQIENWKEEVCFDEIKK